ncbi:MAG: S41 family peptidase [Nannocystaceae bacterium]|nr:S41 family peptidase [bacterium]
MKTELLTLGLFLFTACDVLVGCDAPGDDAAGVAGAEAAVDGELDTLVAKAGAPVLHMRASDASAVMPDAKATFEQVRELVQSKYVEGPLTDDALWTGATEGMLDRLVQLPGHPVNTLLDPRELAELEAGTKGSIVGVGVAIELVADVVVVREIIGDGPASEANLEPGDRILGVDGTRIKGMSLADVVGRIRGEVGTEVSLFVQRDTEEWTETLERGAVKVQTVKAEMLANGVGLLRVTSFAKRTAQEARAHLETLSEQGMTSLIVDFRKCPGGLLDTAIDTASLLLAPGTDIVVLEKRDAPDEIRRSEGATPWQSIDTVALVGPHTASGAEIVVEALAAAGRTVVLGEETFGKATVESIHELQNGWALKLSISRFHAPGSERAVGEGVQPDIVVPHGDGERDVQLDAAIKVLTR